MGVNLVSNNKKWLVTILAVLISLVFTGCSNSSNEKPKINDDGIVTNNDSANVPSKGENKTNEPIVSDSAVTEVQSIDPLITTAGGLGDTKEAIEKIRGKDENEEGAALSAYQNKTFLSMYSIDDVTKKNIANNVTLSFEGTEKGRRTHQEALDEAVQIIPTDAKKVKEYTVDDEKNVIQYESMILGERLKGYYDFATFIDSENKPGTFIIILKYDTDGAFSVISATGNTP